MTNNIIKNNFSATSLREQVAFDEMMMMSVCFVPDQ